MCLIDLAIIQFIIKILERVKEYLQHISNTKQK